MNIIEKTYYRATRAEISLDALAHNINEFRQQFAATMKIMASVKANAYGHGAVEIARAAVAYGVNYLGVAFLDEALQLRSSGITAPILVLGYTPIEGVPIAIEQDITLNVYDEALLDAAAQLSTKDKPLRIHVKVDSGMGRLGVRAGEEAVAFVKKAIAYEGIDVEGLFTHFAKADETNKSYTYEQYRLFHSVVEALQANGIEIPLIHSGNSATGIEFPELSYNMIRLGVSMYGMYPSDEVDTTKVALQPVMSLKTALTMVKKTEAGSGISYGTIYQTAYEEWIGTLPVGYADGYTRMLTGKTSVLVRGQRVPVVGRICMDQCMVSLHGLERVEEIAIGEEVVLMGRQGDEIITAEELAHTLGTINYEITCMVAARIPRVYIRDGIEVAIVNPLW